MSYQELAQIIQSTNKLSPDEQLQLIAHLTNIRDNGHQRHQPQKGYSWHDIAGILPAHPLDEDAQAWISRTRQGGDLERRLIS
jgi:hypothetical protein